MYSRIAGAGMRIGPVCCWPYPTSAGSPDVELSSSGGTCRRRRNRVEACGEYHLCGIAPPPLGNGMRQPRATRLPPRTDLEISPDVK